MSERIPPADPERLTGDARLGPLIERANGAYRARLDEAEAFRRLSQRLQPRRRWVLAWPQVTVAAALGAAAGVALMLQLTREEPSQVAFGPELTQRPRVSAAPPADPAAAGSLAAEEDDDTSPGPARLDGDPDLERAPATDRQSEGSGRSAIRRGSRSVSERDGLPRAPRRGPDAEGAAAPAKDVSSSLPAQGVAPSDDAPPTAAIRIDCLDLARQGDQRGAESCFVKRGAGTGLSAEMALYELARLRRDVLRDASGALSALDDYRQRFPRGSLQQEVDITRIELLSDLGRNREALRESEALLASPSGKERAAELHLLRGNIFRHDGSDWKSASSEYAKAEALGGTTGAEATRLRGVSLEALGDRAGALAAYRRYLAGAEQPRKAEVARRVEALTAASITSP